MAALLWIRYSVVLSVIPYLAWPTSAANRRSFSINQLTREENSQPLNISTAFARNLLRYGGEWPRSIVSSAETASVLALSQNEEFLIPVSVGASTLHLTIDTGSSDLWVFSSQLPQDQRGEHAVYKPSVYSSKSSTQTWAIRYADGSSASGDLYYDVVGVEGIWVMQQAVEIATEVSKNLAHNSASDGVLGLGFSNLNKVRPERQKTFFENAKLQLELPLFAAILKQNASGSYDFGFIDKSKYIGELKYVDVDSSRGHWSFNVSGYDIGNGELTNDPLKSVIDTGASLIFLPEKIVRAYYQQVIGAENNAQSGEWTVPCSSFLPSFTTSIGEYKAVVLGDMLKLGPVIPGSSQCLGGIQSNMNARVSIFGHVFLKTQYVVFDDRGPRLGFARQF
ncbi:aspartic endopeptidase Pep1 aspergillopepsin F protein [Rutstroemia sp. NJR-2017a WRK4]|nr:aspartic endopeptidase Pep1 aspergillopepsin F protein [Rutstroemia sp. NJR-2017a WRK4]